MGGMDTISKWLVYGIVLTTLMGFKGQSSPSSPETMDFPVKYGVVSIDNGIWL